MSLANRDTGEVVEMLSADRARHITDQIRTGVEAIWHFVTEAYTGGAWLALGYDSWDDYCTREFGTSRLRLPREERQEIVSSLRESGLSQRAIAAATGTSQRTVERTLKSGDANASPDPKPVTGIDGKTYSPRPAPRLTPEDDERSEERQHEQDRLGAIRRTQNGLRDLVNGWIRLVSLADHPDRDEVLAGLTDADRDKTLEIEAIYLNGRKS